MTHLFRLSFPRLGWAWLAVVVLASGSFGILAIPDFVTTAKAAKTSPLDRAKAQLKAGKSAKALTIIEELIDSLPSPSILQEAYLVQATALKQSKQISEAVSVLEQLLEEFPFAPVTNAARVLLAELHIETKDYTQALHQLYLALDYATEQASRRTVLQLIRQAEQKNNNPLGAVKAALNEMMLVEPSERLELEQFTQSLILQHLDEESLQEIIESHSTRYPGDIATIRLIEIHTSRGDEVLAERDIRSFLKRFPSHPYAQTAMALLQSFISKIKLHPHILGVALPFSGPMKPYGTDLLNGIRLAIDIAKEEWGLSSVGLVVKDTTTLSAPLRVEIQQLLNEYQPRAVIGPLLSREIRNLGRMPDNYATPFITPSSTLLNVRQYGSYWFNTAMTSSVQAKRLVEYAMMKLDYHRFCIIYPKTSYGRELADMFAKEVIHSGGEVIAVERYTEEQTDIGEQLRRVKVKDLKQYGLEEPEETRTGEERLVYTPGFDAVFLPGQPVHLAIFAAQLAFFDMNVPIMGGNSWHNPEIFRWAKQDLDGSIFVDGFFLKSPDPSVQMFIQRYRSRFQTDPSLFAVQAFDATTVVLETIRKGAQSGQDVWDQLVRRSDLPALSGFASFSSAGILNRRLYILEVNKRSFTQLN